MSRSFCAPEPGNYRCDLGGRLCFRAQLVEDAAGLLPLLYPEPLSPCCAPARASHWPSGWPCCPALSGRQHGLLFPNTNVPS